MDESGWLGVRNWSPELGPSSFHSVTLDKSPYSLSCGFHIATCRVGLSMGFPDSQTRSPSPHLPAQRLSMYQHWRSWPLSAKESNVSFLS